MLQQINDYLNTNKTDKTVNTNELDDFIEINQNAHYSNELLSKLQMIITAQNRYQFLTH